jgi:transcriptional regulator with XRE-family HTH domain
MSAAAVARMPVKQKKKSQAPPKLTWDFETPRPPKNQPADLGPCGVARQPGQAGRRSPRFPDINISATARQLGVTKSHLSKVLLGLHRPSMKLAMGIAAALQKDIYWVASLYKSPVAENKPKPRKK